MTQCQHRVAPSWTCWQGHRLHHCSAGPKGSRLPTEPTTSRGTAGNPTEDSGNEEWRPEGHPVRSNAGRDGQLQVAWETLATQGHTKV